jgi:putative transposase
MTTIIYCQTPQNSSHEHEQIKKRIYQTRAEARSEIFDYIEGFYNRVRRHKHLDQLSPHEFERQRETAL